MSGPGIDEEGNLIGEPQDTYFVSTTQIYVSEEQTDAFFGLAGKVILQLSETPGLVGYALGGDDACLVNRTMGIWESEEAMYAFVASGAHAEAMPKTAHWTMTGDEVVALTSNWSTASWDEARARLEDVGYLEGY
jgi:heme-degrading monooxygenase HmoA